MRWFSLLSPLATLVLAWFSFLFILFMPPLWLLWPFWVIGLGVCNYWGIRQVLGRDTRGRRWPAWFNVAEWVVVVALLMWVWP